MKVLLFLLYLAALSPARSQPPLALETAPATPWITPLDLSLGTTTTCHADQIYGRALSLECEARPLVSFGGRSLVSYRWFVRNELDRTLRVAALRPPSAPINPLGQSRVYGATWVSTNISPHGNTSLYLFRARNASGWSEAPERPADELTYAGWHALAPQDVYEIHREVLPASAALAAAIFSVPFQIDGLAGEATLYSSTRRP